MMLQKPLGWLQRFLYNVELGPIPPPQATISIDWDWPLDVKRSTFTITTVVGTVNTTVYDPGQEKHGLILFFSVTGGTAADSGFATLSVPVNAAVRIYTHDSLVGAIQNIIGGLQVTATGTERRGITPVYVPAGGNLVYGHQSGTAAVALGASLLILERPKSYPLRVP
jgi:hypothetical protein